MHRSVSEPSLTTSKGKVSQVSHIVKGTVGYPDDDDQHGNRLWEGKWAKVTYTLMKLPWNMWWQILLILIIVSEYVYHLLIAYYFETHYSFLLVIAVITCEFVFFLDCMIQLAHMFWKEVRLHIRVYRRTFGLLMYDVFSSLFSVTFIVRYFMEYNETMESMTLIVRWLIILRIYRLLAFFLDINGKLRKSRLWHLVLENFVSWVLIVHMFSCVWYHIWNSDGQFLSANHKDKLPGKLKFDDYLQCFYYCTCRLFNAIFGKVYLETDLQKALTSCIMLIGFVITKYLFIGCLTWEMVTYKWRWVKFVDNYRHMMKYLKISGAPSHLVEQSKEYMVQLWNMKDGILTTDELKKIPHSLQTELIFDINVAYLHNSLLFRDTDESYMRQVSLLMKHEIYMAGQVIWSQGVVKNGMFCIKKGVVELLSEEDDESPMISFKDGTVLGELCLFYSIPSRVTVKAATYVELQTLKRTDYMRAMMNPQMLATMRTKVAERLQRTMSKQKAIDKFEENDSRLIRTRYRPMKLLKDRLAGVPDEDPTFVDDSHLYYRDENNERCEKFTEEYLELYVLSPNVTTIENPRICLNSNFPWILEPDTTFTLVFDIIHFIAILYICFATPIHAILDTEGQWEEVMFCIICILVLNIYLQLTTSIVNKGERKETVKEIAAVKMSTFGFYLDLFSIFPLQIFADSLDPDAETVAQDFSGMFSMVQVWHLWDYIQRWEKTFESNVKLFCLCKYSLFTVIFCYWTGCLLYIYSCPKLLCREESWMARLIFSEMKLYVTNDAKHERPLLSSLSFGVAVFTGNGSESYSPGVVDLLLMIPLLVIGFYFCSRYTAEICANYLLSSQRKVRFKESIRELNYFLTTNRVSNKIKSRVRNFFIVQWYYNKAICTKQIFKAMSPNIQQEVMSVEMVKSLLHCPLFQECSEDFLQTVASNVSTVVLPDDEVVQHAADIGRDMYIIHKGYCNVLDQNGKIVRNIGPRSDFGVIEMLYGLPKVYTVLTSTNCILRHIEYTALVQSWSSFPESSEYISGALKDPELEEIAEKYEEAKPMIGKFKIKRNRIAQELQESFIMVNQSDERIMCEQVFSKLGYFRYIRYIFLPFCITPHGIFLKIWCYLRIISALYYIIYIPYFNAVKWHTHDALFAHDDYFDIFLYVDLVVMAYVAYYNEQSLLIRHPVLTVIHYLKTKFLWDILAVFPFEHLVGLLNIHIDQDLCRLNRLLLVTRIMGAVSYWDSDIVHVNPALVMLKFLPLLLTYVNLTTSIIFMNSCVPTFNEAANQIFVTCRKRYGPRMGDLTQIPAVWKYFTTLYWVFQVFVGCGCTNISITGSFDVWLVNSLRITGFLYFAFMFGYMVSTGTVTSRSLLEHNDNKADLENFLYQENVDPVLTSNTLKYFEYVWKRTNGGNPQKICRRLNSALMEDTLVFMYEPALREVPLFGKVERSFIRVITQHLREMYFLKGETVIQFRDMMQHIFIIYRGKIDVLNSYNEMVSCMGPGGMFGNFTGQPISSSEVSIYASRSLDLLMISSHTFFNLIKYYPKLKEPLKKCLAISRDYILPINMDISDDSTEDDDVEQDDDMESKASVLDSKSSSARFDWGTSIQSSASHSTISTSKSGTSTQYSYQSYMRPSNLMRPGTWLFQSFGYFTSIMATTSYSLVLYEIVTLNDCVHISWVQACFDIYFYIKIYLNINQAYINKRGVMVIDNRKCVKRYFKHKWWVLSDLFANFPFEVFGLFFASPEHIMHYLRINKLFRLKYLVEFYKKTAAELTNNFATLQAATTALVVFLLMHSGTCFWIITAVFVKLYNANLTQDLSFKTDLKHTSDRNSTETEITWNYLTSLYLIVSELTASSGDEFLINNFAALLICAAVMVCGKMLAALVVATAVQISYSTNHALTMYERSTSELMDMLENQGLSSYQRKNFWRYLKLLWVSERGRQLPALLSDTPYVRLCDLMSAMFGHHLRSCYIFADTGQAFLRQLAAVLEYTIYFPGNYIVTEGDSMARMYWVNSGQVAVVLVRNDLTDTTHDLLCAGDVFGILQGLCRGVPHTFSYKAETKVSVLALSLDSWVNIVEFFPEAKQIIEERTQLLFSSVVNHQ